MIDEDSMDLWKKEYYINLFDFTRASSRKTKGGVSEYYFGDLSLGEMIWEAYGVSRTAIYDRLRKIRVPVGSLRRKAETIP